MRDAELISTTISRYRNVLRIEQAEDREAEIAAQKRELRAALESMGVNVETLKVGKQAVQKSAGGAVRVPRLSFGAALPEMLSRHNRSFPTGFPVSHSPGRSLPV